MPRSFIEITLCDLGFHPWVKWQLACDMIPRWVTEHRACEWCGKYQTKYAHENYLWMEPYVNDGWLEDFEQVVRLVKQKQKQKREAEERARNVRASRSWKHGEVQV